MSYETSYNLPTKADNEAKALQDCKDYLGSQFDHVVNTLRQEMFAVPGGRGFKYAYVRDCLHMFVGIEGYYPVRAMVREVLK